MKTNEPSAPEIRRTCRIAAAIGLPAFFALAALLTACSPSPSETMSQSAHSAVDHFSAWKDRCHASGRVVVERASLAYYCVAAPTAAAVPTPVVYPNKCAHLGTTNVVCNYPAPASTGVGTLAPAKAVPVSVVVGGL